MNSQNPAAPVVSSPAPSKASLLASQTPGAFQGTILWWGLTDAIVSDADFRRRWSEAGLPDSALCGLRSSHRNLTDAAKLALVGVDGYLVRPIEKSSSVTKLAIVRETRDPANDRVVHAQECLILLTTAPSPADPTVTVATLLFSDPAHPLATRIHAEWTKLEGSTTAFEIRKAIISMLGACSAVVLREHGGVYWVADKYAPTVEALKKVIEETGRSQFDVLPLFATAIGSATVAASAKRSIADEVEALKAEVEKFKASAPSAGVLGRRLTEYDDLRAKARLYRDVLSMDVGEMEQALADLETSVEAMLNAAPPSAAEPSEPAAKVEPLVAAPAPMAMA
jgi:hypothetical protein